MGLCKCPQRKITNIFCYEHRVNVCEHCLMSKHTKCVVDTYRNWITDSEYSSKCVLCDHELVESDTLRLLCFHIVHWDCLDAWARSLPATTAPAGYTCPVCKQMCLFPALNQVSPIADVLREKMGQVNWARAGLGLPLLEEEIAPVKRLATNGFPNDSYNSPEADKRSDIVETTNSSPFEPSKNFHRHSSLENHLHAQEDNNFNKLNQSYGNSAHYYNESSPAPSLQTNTRKNYRSETPLLIDEDDNKYRRRSPFESLQRWLKNVTPISNRRANRKRALYIVLSVVVLIVLFMILVGRREDEEDFGPLGNPNVIIGNGRAHLETE